jgi:hypothetical protein
MEKYEQYLAEFMQQHNTSGVKKWGIQTVEFNTLMQIVH